MRKRYEVSKGRYVSSNDPQWLRKMIFKNPPIPGNRERNSYRLALKERLADLIPKRTVCPTCGNETITYTLQSPKPATYAAKLKQGKENNHE